MLIDGLELTQTSNAANFTVESGATLPSAPNTSRLFYKTGITAGLYTFTTEWILLTDAVHVTSLAQPNGVATLDATGAVPTNQLPPLNYVLLSTRAQANGVATLGADGKIPDAQLPSLSLTDTYVVNNQSAMLALTAQVGDVAIRTDSSKTFILQTAPASTLGNWKELLSPIQDAINAEVSNRAIADSLLVPIDTKGQPNGVASLDSSGAVPTSQLPPLNYVTLAVMAQPDGVATLNSLGKVPDSQLNTYNSSQIDSKLSLASTSLYHGTPYDIASAVVNKPAGNAKVFRFAAVRLFSIPANAVGSIFKAGTVSSGNAIFTMYKNSSIIGTIAFATGVANATCVVTAATFDVGDILGITAPPAQDTTLADIMFTIAAQL